MTVPVTSLPTNDLEPPEDLEPLQDLDPLDDLDPLEDLEAPAGLQAPQSIESPVAEPLGAILEVSPAALPAESGSLGLEGPGAEVIETPQVARWFAVQVASSCEKKVKATLEQRAVTLGVDNRILEIEIPQTPGVKLKKDGSRQSIDEKVFPGYVLVRMILDEDTMMAVRSTPNVINFVGQEERRATGKARGHIRPRPLSRQEVDRIFKRAAEKKPVVKVDISEGDQILVTAGPFKDFQGEVIDVSGERNKLKALLSIFGRETPVELEFSQISKQN
jgi:transcriptional antiterminator NusG